MSDPRKPQLEILEVFWVDLKPHIDRQVVFIVHDSLDLMTVGTEMINDNKTLVEEWIKTQKIVRPNKLQIDYWSAHGASRFNFTIVQPYVLIQPLPEDPAHRRH